MNLFLWAAVVVMAGGFIWSIVDRAWGWEFPGGCFIVAVVLAVIGLFSYMDNTPESIAQRAQDEASRKAALIPHVVREFDGCKVYRWRNSDSDHWHYVTKCPHEVTTESAHTESKRSGKTTTNITVPEIIKTER